MKKSAQIFLSVKQCNRVNFIKMVIQLTLICFCFYKTCLILLLFHLEFSEFMFWIWYLVEINMMRVSERILICVMISGDVLKRAIGLLIRAMCLKNETRNMMLCLIKCWEELKQRPEGKLRWARWDFESCLVLLFLSFWEKKDFDYVEQTVICECSTEDLH